jgi:hypothetical protein
MAGYMRRSRSVLRPYATNAANTRLLEQAYLDAPMLEAAIPRRTLFNPINTAAVRPVVIDRALNAPITLVPGGPMVAPVVRPPIVRPPPFAHPGQFGPDPRFVDNALRNSAQAQDRLAHFARDVETNNQALHGQARLLNDNLVNERDLRFGVENDNQHLRTSLDRINVDNERLYSDLALETDIRSTVQADNQVLSGNVLALNDETNHLAGQNAYLIDDLKGLRRENNHLRETNRRLTDDYNELRDRWRYWDDRHYPGTSHGTRGGYRDWDTYRDPYYSRGSHWNDAYGTGTSRSRWWGGRSRYGKYGLNRWSDWP